MVEDQSGFWPALRPLCSLQLEQAGPVYAATFPEQLISHSATRSWQPRTHREEGLGCRVLIHQHLLVLPMSRGYELVPLPRWGALLGKQTETKVSKAEGRCCRLQEALSDALRRVPLCSHPLDLLDPLSPHQVHLDATLIVDEVLDPPFCSQRLFLLMSPATISWGQKEGPVTVADS